MATLLDNLAIKIVALFLGLLLWFHVATEKNYSYELKLPLADVLLDSGLTLSRNPPDSVLVVVSASGKLLLRNKWRVDGLRINAAQFPAGRHNLGLTTANTSLPATSNFVTLDEIVFPNSLELQIDHETQRQVSIKLDIEPFPDEGYTVRSISQPVPDEVTVTGPRSVVNRFEYIMTEKMNITSLRTNLSLNLRLVKPTGYGIELSPDSVAVDIEVVPVKTRVFHKIPVVIFNVPSGQSALVDPVTVTVTLTGSPDEVDRVTAAAIVVAADLALASGDGRAALWADCPPNLSIKSLSVDSVSIRVE